MTDWGKLKTAKGKGTWIPERLEVLRLAPGPESGELRDKAFRKLGRDLFNGAKWQSAAPAAVAALVDLVLEGAPERHRLLSLLARLVAVNPAPYLVGGFDLADAETKKKYARGTGKKVHAALWERGDEIAALLADDDPVVRAATAYLLLFDGRDREGTAKRLRGALANEEHSVARATMTYVLGLCGPADSANGDELTAAIATLATFDGGAVDESLVTLVRTAPVESMPLDDGRVDMLAARVVEARGGRAAAADLLVAAMGVGHPFEEQWVAGVLELGFALAPNHDPRSRFLIGFQGRSADTLDDDQRRWLERLSEHPWNAPFGSYGLPIQLRVRRRWLGMDPAGVLERSIPIEVDGKARDAEVWRWLRHFRELEVGMRFAALEEHLSPLEILEAMGEASMSAYGLSLSHERVAERAQEMGDDALPWARRFVDELAVAVERDRHASFRAFGTRAAIKPGDPTAGVALELLLAAGETIDESFDPLIPPSSEPLLDHVGAERCEAIVLRSLERFDRAPDLREANLSWVVNPMKPAIERSPTAAVAERLAELRARLGTNGRYEDVLALDEALAFIEQSR